MSLIRGFTTTGGLTLASRVAGFVRDILTAAMLGAGPIADAFFVALKLPNLFRRVFAEGAFSVAFVPIFAGELEERGAASAKEFAERTAAVMVAILLPLTGLAILAMPSLVPLIAPGFVDDPVRFEPAVAFARDTFPYLMLMSLTALYGGVLNSLERFAPFAAAPILFNLCLIGGLLVARYTDLAAGQALAWAVPIAGIAQLLLVAFVAARAGMALRLPLPVLSPRIRRLFRNMGPAALGAGVMQINAFADLILASLLPVGAISFLYYADRLYQLPLGVIGIAIGTALLPILSRLVRKAKLDGNDASAAAVAAAQNRAIEYAMLLALPAAGGLLALAWPLISTLFERGAFDGDAARLTAYALMGYAIGVPAYVLIKILQTAFYARQDTGTPMRFAVVATLANILGSVALILILPPRVGHVGIALSTGVTAWLNVALLARRLGGRGWFAPDARLRARLVRQALVTLAMIGGLVVAALLLGDALAAASAWQIPTLLLLVAGAMAFYFAACQLAGAVRLGEFARVLRRR
ncbi:MAG: murein biosynthesis integral membrane protein MurJ [Azospirillaceae bacterium]